MSGGLFHQLSDAAEAKAVSLAAGGVVATCAGYGRWLISRRLPARRMWRYRSGDKFTLIVASSAQVDTGKYVRPTTGIGQVRAMSLLVPSLARAYRKVDLEQVQLSAVTPGKDLEADLLVLGGAKNNAVTARLLDHLPGLPFTSPDDVIVWEGTSYEGVTNGPNVVRDYGYVVRAPNPFAPGRRVVIVAGSHTFGTVAAARWLAKHGGDRKLPADVAVLVESEVLNDGHVTAPKAIHQVAL